MIQLITLGTQHQIKPTESPLLESMPHHILTTMARWQLVSNQSLRCTGFTLDSEGRVAMSDRLILNAVDGGPALHYDG
jgi:hypothetical protein